MAASNYGPHSYDSLRKAMNETTASERERFEAWRDAERPSLLRHAITYLDHAELHSEAIAWDAWQARAALPAPADQPPEHQGSSGSLSESGAEVGTLDAASASGSLSEIRRTAQVAEAAWWCKNAVRHVRFVSIDAASSIEDRAAAVRAAEEAIDKLVALL